MFQLSKTKKVCRLKIGRPNLLSPQGMPFGVAPLRSPLSHPCNAKLAKNRRIEL